MAYEITVDHERGYLNLRYSGEIAFEERIRARDDVFNLCRQHTLSRSLVEMQDSDIRMTESDVIRFARGFEKSELPPNYRLACVVAPDGQSDSLLEIMIALEGVNVKYFINREPAMNWLLAL